MGIGIWQLVVVLLIVALLFGTKKLRTIGSDLGSALKGFRSALKDEDTDKVEKHADNPATGKVIEGEVEKPLDDASRKS